MQELGKILEEIELEKKRASLSPDCSNEHAVTEIILLEKIEKIIRKHMNDGWIPVEERLPNGGIDVEVTVRRGYRTIGYYNELFEEWYSTDESGLIDAIAWKEPSEPYRPERSNGE